MIYIIILNWNGYEDTIECLKSIANSYYQLYKIIIIDNKSSDNSVLQLTNYIEASYLTDKVELFQNSQNDGFAKGCNIGIERALHDSECKYIWLLNNDTVILPDTIGKLFFFLENNPQYSIITPQINYYSNSSIIWNCGGKINKLGFRKYYYANKSEATLPKKEIIDISFITNCASFFRKEFFNNNIRLDERFFFGEEDFTLSMNAKINDLSMACLLTTKIFHKVSCSLSKDKRVLQNKVFLHYLNRLINMKRYFHNKLFFSLFKYLYFFYIFYLLSNYHVEKKIDWILKLNKGVEKYNNVDYKLFKLIILEGNYDI